MTSEILQNGSIKTLIRLRKYVSMTKIGTFGNGFLLSFVLPWLKIPYNVT
jgi:hypothetical protein